MKNHTIVILLLCILALYIFLPAQNKPKSEVFFSRDISADGILKIYEKIADSVEGRVAIKVHFGEDGNQNFLDPELIRKLSQELGATLVETNVLYVSKRRYTASHIQLARDHGFDFAPIDILDSEGEEVIKVDSKHYQEIKIGSHMKDYDTFIIFSHFKGHGMAGFGGAIKNIGMGLASIAGKMALHASTIPIYNPDLCIQCGRCVQECPGDAITINPLVIDPEKCIGCGSCIGVCPTRAFNVPWGSTDKSIFLERLVEYTKGIADNNHLVYINVLANISRSCDCARWPDKPFMDDIGILASTDLVAIEKASHDLVDQAHNCDDTFLKENSVSGKNQIEYASKLGLGNKNYTLINIDE